MASYFGPWMCCHTAVLASILPSREAFLLASARYLCQIRKNGVLTRTDAACGSAGTLTCPPLSDGMGSGCKEKIGYAENTWITRGLCSAGRFMTGAKSGSAHADLRKAGHFGASKTQRTIRLYVWSDAGAVIFPKICLNSRDYVDTSLDIDE